MAVGDRIAARNQRQEAQQAALPGILGQPCTPTWDLAPEPPGSDSVRWLWAQIAKSPIIARGVLDDPAGKRSFRIVCNREIAVVHPDDAGWLVRAVEPYMTRVKPIWAQTSNTRTVAGGAAGDLTVRAGLFPWIPQQWTCPECWPQIDTSNACDPRCTVDKIWGGADARLRAIWGYDPRAMMPWASNVAELPACNQGGPGGPNTLCMPVDRFCWSQGVQASTYVQAFWQDVAQAVAKYNEVNKDVPPPSQPATSAIAATPAMPIPKRAPNFYPLLAFGFGVGLLSVFVWNVRRN